MVENPKCPSDETLILFLNGAMPVEEEQQITSHLENCTRCEEGLNRLDQPEVGSLEAEVLTEYEQAPATAGRYQLTRELARGGMGIVYSATDPLFERAVAVKLLRPLLCSHPDAQARFLDEAKLTGQLDHPGIPAVHDIGELPDGRPFLVMKLIAGRTLAELLASETVARESLLPTMLSVCQTVGFAHSRGIVHRDLKPANVMVGSFGEVQVLDWGLGKSVAQTDDPFGFLRIEVDRDSGSVSGAAVGSAPYASPEQARGQRDKIDLRSDVFSLGAILVELMTGAPPA